MSVTVKHPFVSAVADSADTSLVRPSNWNADHTIIGLGTAAEKDVGVANGVASLDSGGKVPVSELPAAVLGALSYQGTWNASTNTPTLASGVGTKGYYYVVSVAGSTDLDGVTDWLIGDWAVYNGTAWQKVDNTDTVTSVNGQTGTVVLTTTNVAEGTNEYFTTAKARASVSAGTGISYDSGTGVITNTNTATGDVVGPASATDNAIVRFDTTTGKLIQNSVVTVSDTGAIDGATTISNIDYIDFDTTYATTLGVGQLGWNGNDTLGLGMIGGNVIQHIGEDQFFYTKATATITKGQVVMFTGAVGASGVPTGAPATGITDGNYIMGIAAENIANNGFGLVQSFGTLKNVNTSGYVDGDILWYNPSVAGGLTKTKPVAPNVKAQIAAVINGGSVGGGTILIRISAGSTLGGTDSNAQIDTPANGQIITYDGLDGYWKNTALTAGTAISVTPSSTGVLTVANTAPDQTVVLTAGTGISTSGTYPNFTITNTAPSSGGTVTSVGGTGTVSGISLSGTVTTSGNLTLGGTLDLSSPPAIGGTTPSTGKFSNLEYTGTLTGGTGVIAIGTNQIYKDASGFVGLGTVTPTDSVGFGRIIDMQSATGAGIYLRDSDAPTTSYTYLAYAGSNSTAYIWNVGNGAILFGTNDVQRLSISAVGTVALAATSGLTIGRTAVSAPAATDGNVFSGTYTPSLTNTTNIASSSISTCQYMRVGNVVTVSGQVTIDPTAVGACNMKMTLPIASNFGSSRQAGGTFATVTSGQADQGAILADATGDQFEFRFTAVNVASAVYAFHVTYLVV